MNRIALSTLALLIPAAGLGVYLGWLYLMRKPMRPGLIGAHFLFGAGSLEVGVVCLRGVGQIPAVKSGVIGILAVSLIALAMLSGLVAGLIARRSRLTADVSLASHATLATAGIVLFVVWVLGA